MAEYQSTGKRKYDQSPVEARVAAVNAFRKRYPEKARAWNMVQRAVKSGVLERPTECSKCGEVAPIEASHDDYSRPLDVEWLCRPCHVAKDRLTHCRRGHEYTPENTIVKNTGFRGCKACRRLNYQARREAAIG